MNEKAREKTYEIVKAIPAGTVSTYSHIAAMAGLRNPRTVGFYLHHNPYPGVVPCHRVVNSAGRLATNFGFGADEQAKLLKKEGVEVINNKVNLEKYLWK